MQSAAPIKPSFIVAPSDTGVHIPHYGLVSGQPLGLTSPSSLHSLPASPYSLPLVLHWKPALCEMWQVWARDREDLFISDFFGWFSIFIMCALVQYRRNRQGGRRSGHVCFYWWWQNDGWLFWFESTCVLQHCFRKVILFKVLIWKGCRSYIWNFNAVHINLKMFNYL